MTQSENAREALAGIARIEEGDRISEEGRIQRDRGVVKMARDDGLRPPQIAKITSMSISNVRAILRLDEARRRGGE